MTHGGHHTAAATKTVRVAGHTAGEWHRARFARRDRSFVRLVRLRFFVLIPFPPSPPLDRIDRSGSLVVGQLVESRLGVRAEEEEPSG